MLQMVKVKNFNARDDESIRHLIHRSNLVVNCIGIQKETMNWSFQETHVDIAAKIAEACKENEMVERFWHVGGLGANENSTSRRLQSKVLMRRTLAGSSALSIFEILDQHIWWDKKISIQHYSCAQIVVVDLACAMFTILNERLPCSLFYSVHLHCAPITSV